MPARSTAEMCTNASGCPSSRWMKPKPFIALKNLTTPVAFSPVSLRSGARSARYDRHRLTVDSQVGRGNASTTIDERELERLAVGQIRQAGLLDSRNVHEHILAAIIANDEAEALLRVEEFDDAFAFANDLGRHSAAAATAAATKAATAAAAAAKATASAAEAAAAATEAITAAAAKAIAAAAVSTATAATESVATAAAEAAAVTIAAAFTTTEEIVALVTAATTAVPLTPFIETHARLKSFVPTSFTPTRWAQRALPVSALLLTHRSPPYSKKPWLSSDSGAIA